MIENYQFGLITIGGKEFRFDVELRFTEEVLKWWREEGHKIDVNDVKRAVKEKPEIIVLGTGAYGVCEVTKECENFIKENGIRLIVQETGEAVKTFNNLLKKGHKVIGLFHLTC